MNGLDEKSVADLEALAVALREQSARDPQYSRAMLADVEWELEKRQWRKPT